MPITVEGSGNRVFWKNCIIRVYKTDNTDEHIDEHDYCDGESVVPRGISLWFGGKPGISKVKEG